MANEQLSHLLLASASPRRAELLEAAGFRFTVRVAAIDETPLPAESPGDYVARLAEAKARAVASEGLVVLGADTTVVIDEQILGKPSDREDARRMIALLSGRWHEVLTGISLVTLPSSRTEVAVTRVKFSELTEHEIDWYTGTGEPDDKAGAYAIQGLGSRFIEQIEGSYSNVVGLPVETLYRMLRSIQ